MTELFTTFLVSVIAGVVSCYICKWLDRDKQAATAYAEWFTVTNKKTPEVAASGVFASHEKSSPHFLAAYIIFYFFNVNMISKSPIQRTPGRNLFSYTMTLFEFFTNNSCFLPSFCYNLCYNVNRRVMVKYHDSIYAKKLIRCCFWTGFCATDPAAAAACTRRRNIENLWITQY